MDVDEVATVGGGVPRTWDEMRHLLARVLADGIHWNLHSPSAFLDCSPLPVRLIQASHLLSSATSPSAIVGQYALNLLPSKRTGLRDMTCVDNDSSLRHNSYL